MDVTGYRDYSRTIILGETGGALVELRMMFFNGVVFLSKLHRLAFSWEHFIDSGIF